ncbi:hypothetical protein M595_1166 [Lyngbya aestuarii BL J]|uniref:Uncharacterized protein n=1 Tax=Lyngbya aestuarii BL J TaxID=1348334 RepID=U7QM15_9CYAN|nr:hypothetical protein [Lyngbya aestuarii]ERT08903.1 hypothetical protein M595_1166 [Lyngbya aestuarii BL J]
MTEEQNVPKESALVETPSTQVTSTSESSGTQPQKETEALLEAIQNLVKVELQTAAEINRDAYAEAVKNVRQSIEQIRLIDKDQIESSFKQFETDAESNFQGIVKDLSDLGERLTKATQAFWDILTASDDSKSK